MQMKFIKKFQGMDDLSALIPSGYFWYFPISFML